MKILRWFFLIVGTSVAWAAGTTANLSWVWPTTYIDGSALPTSDLKSIKIEWRRTSSGPVLGTVTVNYPATTTTVPGLVCGDYIFVGYATVQSGDSSDASNTATYTTGIKCRPGPPILSVG